MAHIKTKIRKKMSIIGAALSAGTARQKSKLQRDSLARLASYSITANSSSFGIMSVA